LKRQLPDDGDQHFGKIDIVPVDVLLGLAVNDEKFRRLRFEKILQPHQFGRFAAALVPGKNVCGKPTNCAGVLNLAGDLFDNPASFLLRNAPKFIERDVQVHLIEPERLNREYLEDGIADFGIGHGRHLMA